MASHSPAPEVDPREQRLHEDSEERSWRGHRFRYHLAAGFCRPDDTVLDAACGSGYGSQILDRVGGYVGVDTEHPSAPLVGRFLQADLGTPWGHEFPFDVFVGFETIEHLADFKPYIALAKQARRHILLSAPIVPTTHLNPFHLHNFAPGELASLVIDDDWSLYQSVIQPAELSEIYVFTRR